MSRITLAVAGVLAIVCAAPAFAQTDLQQVTPIRRVEPVVLGYATAIGTHTLNVDVPQSAAMAFEFDSRTVMPRELQMGTPVRIDFRLLENGTHFANRVTPILPGSNDWRAIESMRVSQRIEPSSETVVTGETTVIEPVSTQTTTTTDVTTTTVVEPAAGATGETENVLASGDANTDSANRLPQTASELPLLLALGSASVAGAIALMIRRRRRA